MLEFELEWFDGDSDLDLFVMEPSGAGVSHFNPVGVSLGNTSGLGQNLLRAQRVFFVYCSCEALSCGRSLLVYPTIPYRSMAREISHFNSTQLKPMTKFCVRHRSHE